MLTEINGNIDATYPIITGELTGYLGPIGTVTASADNSVGTPHVIVTQTPTPDGLNIDFAFKEMGIPGLDLTVEQDLTEEQQQTARENIDAQETLTFDNIPTSGSSNPVTSAGIYAADEDLKDYVDDSINRSSAFFRGNFATYAALMAVPWQTTDPDAPNFVSNNDYAAVADDETHSHESWRYIYVLEEGGQDNGWTAQYRINESPFTVEQLAAINSGITANDVTKLAGIEQGAQVNIVTGVKGDAEANYRTGNINITKANIGLGNVDNTSDANKPVSTAQQAAIDAATKALYDVKSAGPAAIVSIHDAEAIPVKSLVAQITPLQDLHGQSAPYPAGGGKNKLNNSRVSETQGGIIYTRLDDGSATFSGSATEQAVFAFTTSVSPLNLAAGNYIFNGLSGGSNSTYFIYISGAVSSATYAYDGDTAFTCTGGEVTVAMYVRSGYAISGTLSVKPMIRLSTESDATFAPYSNICPISGWTGANIHVADDENPHVIDNVYPIDWTDEAGTVYGGTLNVTTGVLTVNKLSLLLGAFDFTTLSTPENHIFRADIEGVIDSRVLLPDHQALWDGALCEAYKNLTYAELSASDNGCYAVSKTLSISQRIVFINHNYSTVADFVTNNSSVRLVYPLATPITYQLTPTEVKTLLGDNNIFCDTGDVQVTYETGTVAVALAGLYEKLAAQIGA